MSEPAPPRIAVLQPGARLHYAVPALLARAGMLQRFYTDFCFGDAAAGYVERLWPLGLQPATMRRALGRRLPRDIPKASVRQIPRAVLRSRIFPGHGPTPTESLLAMARRDRFGGAHALYTVIVNQDLELCTEAKNAGMRVIHESMLNPDIGLWLNEEHERFPDVVQHLPPIEEIHRGRARDRQKFAMSDRILVPSDFVRQSVIALGAAPDRVRLVPYGIDARWLHGEPRPIHGRVLFVGSVGLLKGSHYLAEAARLLSSRNVKCDVRVVGPACGSIVQSALFAGPAYVGQVPRSEVLNEFLTADIFVLPTLCDGFALAHLEALACGLPVITTPNCGSVVRDGQEGFIVPVRDARHLADAIERLVGDRVLRAQLSRNARARAAEFTWQRYGERLIDAVSDTATASLMA